MVQPWADAGYECWCVDLAEVPSRSENLRHFQVDVREFVSRWSWHDREIAAVFAFPPCTHLAVSGARWFRSKGLRGVIEGLEIVEACREVCEASKAPWMLENPVSTLSTYWREPDYSFDPWEYSDFVYRSFSPPAYPKCEGDLVGEDHSAECPLYRRNELTRMECAIAYAHSRITSLVEEAEREVKAAESCIWVGRESLRASRDAKIVAAWLRQKAEER